MRNGSRTCGTHILIWSLDSNSPLSKKHKELLEDTGNRIFASLVNLLELSIKKNLNKLPEFIPEIKEVAKQCSEIGFELLSISDEHIFAYQYLPLFSEHKDPFDRLLIATAKEEGFAIMTTDDKFHLYESLITLV